MPVIKPSEKFFLIVITCFLLPGINVFAQLTSSACFTAPDTSTSNVLDFGATGDGLTDDTDAIIATITRSGNGVVEFPRGRYRITRTIGILLDEYGPISLSSLGGSATIIMDAGGPACRFTGTHMGTGGAASLTTLTWEKERMPLVYNLVIEGSPLVNYRESDNQSDGQYSS
jgi:hypothetical protein